MWESYSPHVKHGENNFPTKKIFIESERKNQVSRKLEKKVGTFCYIVVQLFLLEEFNKLFKI